MLGDFSGRVTLAAHDRAYTFGAQGRPADGDGAGRQPRRPRPTASTTRSAPSGCRATCRRCPTGGCTCCRCSGTSTSGRWLDWKETTPIPDGAHDLKQIWNVNCFNCHATNLDRGYQPAARRLPHAVDRAGHRLRGLPRPGPRAHRAHRGLGEGSVVDADATARGPRTAQLVDDAQDLLAALGRPAPHLRQLRLLPRQQAQPVHHLRGWRSLRRPRAAVPAERAAARVRRPGRVLARRPAQPLQPAAGADAVRLLQGRRHRLHQLPRRARIGHTTSRSS